MREREMSKWLRVGKAAQRLGVHPQTLRGWERDGKIPARRMGVRQERRFDIKDVDALAAGLGRTGTGRVALYVRVSTTGQESSLLAQEEELRLAAGARVSAVFLDRASGLDERRRGLARLRAAAARREFDEVWVTHDDRLTRFGGEFLRAELAGNGVTTRVLHERETVDGQQELLDDFMSLLASFSSRVYGQRGVKARKRLLREASSR